MSKRTSAALFVYIIVARAEPLPRQVSTTAESKSSRESLHVHAYRCPQDIFPGVDLAVASLRSHYSTQQGGTVDAARALHSIGCEPPVDHPLRLTIKTLFSQPFRLPSATVDQMFGSCPGRVLLALAVA